MNVNFDNYERSFETAQAVFGGGIDTIDRSQQVLAANAQQALDFLTGNQLNDAGFREVEIDSELLKAQPALYVGRTLLMHNARLGVLSPAIITANPERVGDFEISMFDMPYDPAIGFSPGMHWSVSVKAQTKVGGFGGHGEKASGLEQGHFGAAILGAQDQAVAEAIISHGDDGTHRALKAGVAETMGKNNMLPTPPITRQLPSNQPFKLMAYWHERLQTDSGPAGGDFPEATRLMLGAGLRAIGDNGLIRVERLVKDAVRGAT